GPDELGDRAQRDRRLAGIPTRLEDLAPAGSCCLRDCGREPRLADPRLALDHQQSTRRTGVGGRDDSPESATNVSPGDPAATGPRASAAAAASRSPEIAPARMASA